MADIIDTHVVSEYYKTRLMSSADGYITGSHGDRGLSADVLDALEQVLT